MISEDQSLAFCSLVQKCTYQLCEKLTDIATIPSPKTWTCVCCRHHSGLNPWHHIQSSGHHQGSVWIQHSQELCDPYPQTQTHTTTSFSFTVRPAWSCDWLKEVSVSNEEKRKCCVRQGWATQSSIEETRLAFHQRQRVPLRVAAEGGHKLKRETQSPDAKNLRTATIPWNTYLSILDMDMHIYPPKNWVKLCPSLTKSHASMNNEIRMYRW